MSGAQGSPRLGQLALNGVVRILVREVVIRAAAALGSVVIARELSPAQFGLFAIAFITVNLFAAFSEVGLGAAFIRRTAPVAPGELNALFTFQLVITALFSAMIFVCAPLVADAFREPALTWLVRALSISLLFLSLRTTPVVACERALNYGPVALADMVRHLSFWCISVTLALLHFGTWALVWAFILSSASATTSLYLRTRWLPKLNFDWRPVLAAFRFGIIYQGQSISHLIKDTMIPLIGGVLYSAKAVGYLTWAVQLAQVVLLVTNVVDRVSYPMLSRLQSDREVFTATLQSILVWTTRVSLPALAVLAALSPQVTGYIYGPKWFPALPSLYIFYVNMLLSVGTGVLLPALYSAGWATVGLRISAVWAALTWALAVAFAVAGVGFEGMALAYTCGTAMALVLIMRAIRRIGQISIRRAAGRTAIAGAITFVILLAVRPLIVNWWSLLLLGFVAYFACVVVSAWDDRWNGVAAI